MELYSGQINKLIEELQPFRGLAVSPHNDWLFT